MKKLYILLIISGTVFSVSSGQFTKIGGGPGFSTGFPFGNLSGSYNKSGNFSAFVKGIYKINLPANISPSFTFFVPNVSKLTQLQEEKITINAMMFDINGHYIVNSSDRFEFYGLAGFDILLTFKKEVIEYTDPVTQKKTESATKVNDNGLGLNFGAGASMKITEHIDLFTEAKYLFFNKYKLIFSKYNQFMINAGVLVNINLLKKNRNTEN